MKVKAVADADADADAVIPSITPGAYMVYMVYMVYHRPSDNHFLNILLLKTTNPTYLHLLHSEG